MPKKVKKIRFKKIRHQTKEMPKTIKQKTKKHKQNERNLHSIIPIQNENFMIFFLCVHLLLLFVAFLHTLVYWYSDSFYCFVFVFLAYCASCFALNFFSSFFVKYLWIWLNVCIDFVSIEYKSDDNFCSNIRSNKSIKAIGRLFNQKLQNKEITKNYLNKKKIKK